MGTVAGVRHHRVRRDDDAALSGELSSGSRGRLSLNRRKANLFLLIGREDRNLLVRDIRPLNKLLTPLHDGHPGKNGQYINNVRVEMCHSRRSTKHQTRLFDRTRCSDTDQSLSSTTR